MASGTCGDNLTWTFDDGTLTISGRGKMENYLRSNPADNPAPWYHCCELITKVVIKDGVTTIGAAAFSRCKSLTSIVIPDSVTTIGEEAFSGCLNLTSIVIPNSVTTIGDCAFFGCWHLTSVVIPDSVTTIGNLAFSSCGRLMSVVIPGTVKAMGDVVFNYCTSLEKIYYKRGLKGAEKLVKGKGNNAKLIPYDEFPPAQVKPPAETNCTVYRNTTISRAENIAPPNTKSWSRVDENIAEIRRAAELAAMNIVMAIERDLGFSPEDVSSQNLGYDIKSTSPDGKTLRLIEVKGRRIDAETVTVSRNEIAAALNNPDNFILAIVRLDGDKNETIYIRKPFEHPPYRAALSANFSIQELVEFKSN